MSQNFADEIISVVYGSLKRHQQGYQALSVFTSYGPVDESTLEEVYEGIFNELPRHCDDGIVAPFLDIEALQKFSFELSQKLFAKGSSLVSVDDYNKILLESFNGEELVKKLQESGNYMANPDAGKSNFFNKIFN